MLRDVAERDLTTELLGQTLPAPVAAGADRRPDGWRTPTASGRPRAPRRRSACRWSSRRPRTPRWRTSPRPSRRGAALVPALLAVGRGRRAEPRRPRRGVGLRRDRRHRRQLHPRLEAARPPARRAAVHQGHRRRPVLHRPGLPRRAGEDARGGPRRRGRPLPRRLRQPIAHLGRPRAPALVDVAADPDQGHPPPRRRGRGARARRRRHRRLEPRRPPGGRRDRDDRRAWPRSPTRSARTSRSCSTRACARAPTRSARSRWAPTPSSSAARGSGGSRSAARPASKRCFAASWPSST